MNNENSNPLLKLRTAIDNIDNQIINLLKERVKVIKEVGEYKKAQGENFFIKSAREADMIKNLVNKIDGALPKSTIVSIWRKIITAANNLEQPIKIAVHNPKKLPNLIHIIQEYYSDFIPIEEHDSVTNIISEIEKKTVQIGIFALPSESDNNSDNWWINLAGNNKNNIRIFAKLPFTENIDLQFTPKINLVAVAIKDAEKSSEDKTLLSIEINKEIGKTQLQNALKEAGLVGRILKSAKLEQVDDVIFNLVEIDGFFEAEDPEISALSKTKIKPYIKIIGSYPTAIKI